MKLNALTPTFYQLKIDGIPQFPLFLDEADMFVMLGLLQKWGFKAEPVIGVFDIDRMSIQGENRDQLVLANFIPHFNGR